MDEWEAQLSAEGGPARGFTPHQALSCLRHLRFTDPGANADRQPWPFARNMLDKGANLAERLTSGH